MKWMQKKLFWLATANNISLSTQVMWTQQVKLQNLIQQYKVCVSIIRYQIEWYNTKKMAVSS